MNNNSTNKDAIKEDEDVKATISTQENEGTTINGTCENVKITHEAYQMDMDADINNTINVSDESHLAIEILDTILENEDDDDGSDKKLSQSINDEKVTQSLVELDEKLEVELPKIIIIIDTYDVASQLDDILERAAEVVESKLIEKDSQVDDSENVFQNEKFLTHLSDLITSKRKAPETQTMHRKKKVPSAIKHSSSAPDLQEILRSADKSDMNDDLRHDKVDEKKIKTAILPMSTTVNNTELFEKFEEMKRRKRLQMEKSGDVYKEETDSSEDESIDKEEFREKLEKLLRSPPTRLSLIRPVPLPRMS